MEALSLVGSHLDVVGEEVVRRPRRALRRNEERIVGNVGTLRADSMNS